MKKIFTFIVVAAFFASCTNNENAGDAGGGDIDTSLIPAYAKIAAPKTIAYTVISQYPHDTSSFTEGLEFYNGKLFESGGDYKNSRLQYGNVKTGKIEQKHMMGNDSVFAEGITILNGKLYQLTYTSNIVYVYDVKDITKPVKTLKWPAQGWGMTNDGTNIILNSGNNNLYFVDPETFAVKKTLPVNDNNGPVQQINELEYIDGFIWSNIWLKNRIVKIDPATGNVVEDMMLDKLNPEETNQDNVLNGIAYDSAAKTIFVTGKKWSKIFELKLN